LGIPYALASLSFCISFNLDLLKASATLTLAELWLFLGSSHATRALNLVHGAFPIILGHGGLELRSRAYIVEAKCYLSDTNFNGMWLKIVDVRLFRLCFHKRLVFFLSNIKNKRLFRICYPFLHMFLQAFTKNLIYTSVRDINQVSGELCKNYSKWFVRLKR
jgi:hypothetical protein